ncbi:hypothetical protein F01_410337 [Burkholderia cenocepacia]|nr:hypothetical protein F01_410337 [Burkholderia cenocepacia]
MRRRPTRPRGRSSRASSAMRAACWSAPTRAGSTGSRACSAPVTSGWCCATCAAPAHAISNARPPRPRARSRRPRTPHDLDDDRPARCAARPRRPPRQRRQPRPRRADRRRRPVRHRRRVSPEAALPACERGDRRGARRDRRHLGPVPLSGRSFGFRHVHARLQLPPVAQRQGDLRRTDDPRLHPRHRAHLRHRQDDPLRPEGRRGRLGFESCALDGTHRAHAGRRDRHARLHLPLPVHVQRLLRLRRRLPARLGRHGHVRGQARASAALAEGSVVREPARGRDRQRRDGRHARAVDGGRRAARDDAAALADLHRVAARARQDRERAAPRAAVAARAPARTREERPADDVPVQRVAPQARPDEAIHHPRGQQAARPRLRRREAPDAALHAVGPARVPRAEWRPVQGDPRGPRIDRHRRDRALHADRPPAEERPAARRGRDRHRDRAEGEDARRCARDGRRPRGRLAGDGVVQGHDVQRRAEPRVVVRLHECVVDAEGRADRALRVPAAQPHARERVRHVRAAARRGRSRRRAGRQPELGLHPARGRHPAEAGAPQAMEIPPELRARSRVAEVQRARRFRDAFRAPRHDRPGGHRAGCRTRTRNPLRPT